MGDLVIRPARPEERAVLADLHRRASLAWGDHLEELSTLPDEAWAPAQDIPHTFVAERDGQLAGFGVVLRTEAGEAELDGLFVEPVEWRGGAGRALVAEAERRARAMGAVRLCVVANDRALAFYQALGFVTVGEVMTAFAPAPRMVKPLA